MSRWREMMMDYGQVFGSDKTGGHSGGAGAGSDVFSITGDLKDKRMSDLQMRRTLEVFVYGGEKIACHDLRRILHDSEYRDRLPPGKVQELADLADFNKGKAISYNEFVNIVLNQIPHDDIASLGSHNDLSTAGSPFSGKMCGGGLILEMCRNTAPPEIVEERMGTPRCSALPVFMVLICLAQILVYAIYNTLEGVTSDPLDGVPVGNVLMYDPTRRREAWRWVTYCLMHQGYVDLIFNIVLQLFLGIPLEMMFSWWRMAIIYFVGVILGSCGHSVSDHYVGLVGAGGGSYAIVGAHLVALVMNWKSFQNYGASAGKKFLCSVTLRVVVICLIVIAQIGLAVYRRWFMDGIALEMGIGAYIGGLLAGATMADAFLLDPRRSPLKHGAALIVLFTFLFFVGVTVIVNIVWFDYPNENFD